MNKVIELAREAGIKNDCDGIWCTADQLERFYTIARADLEAENAKLREALRACIDYGAMTGADWVTDKARAALGETK